MPTRINDELVIDDLYRVNSLLGHAPSFEEMRNNGTISPSTCLKHFGPTWEDVKRKIGWKPHYETFSPNVVSESDAAWFCGVIDGEGCFRIQSPSPNGGNGLSRSYSPLFCMSLRDDDKQMLEKFVSIMGCQNDIRIDNYNREKDKGNPAAKVSIRDIARLWYHLIPTIHRYGLNSKKKFELPWFELAVSTLINKKINNRTNFGYTNCERLTLYNCKCALHELKQYNSDRFEIAKKYNVENIYK